MITSPRPTLTAEQALEGVDVRGAVAVVTGGYSGLGLEVTRVLSRAGAFVVVPVRDRAKAERALDGMPGVEQHPMDLADPDSISSFAQRLVTAGLSIDMLINNGGVMAVPLEHDRRGFETHLAVNYFGHVDLTRHLWPALTADGGARVISLSSRAYRFSGFDFKDPHFQHRTYEKWSAYGQSMTAKAMFAVELDARGKSSGVRAFAVHPGTILTDLSRHLSRLELMATGAVDADGVPQHPAGYKTVAEGAATTVWAATSPDLNGTGGLYLDDAAVAPRVNSASNLFGPGVDPWLLDTARARRLWTYTEHTLGARFAATQPATTPVAIAS